MSPVVPNQLCERGFKLDVFFLFSSSFCFAFETSVMTVLLLHPTMLFSPCLLLQERESLEEERRRVEELRRRCEEKERLIPSQPESQREQLTLQLQQVSDWVAFSETQHEWQQKETVRAKTIRSKKFSFIKTSTKLAEKDSWSLPVHLRKLFYDYILNANIHCRHSLYSCTLTNKLPRNRGNQTSKVLQSKHRIH